MAVRIKFGAQIMNQIWTRGFFSCMGRVSFMLRTFGAQINWRVKSRKVLFDPHRFVKQIAYSFCCRERKRKYVSQWQTARSKWKWTLITTVPDLCPTTVKILTHLISRYHLPLMTKWEQNITRSGWIMFLMYEKREARKLDGRNTGRLRKRDNLLTGEGLEGGEG